MALFKRAKGGVWWYSVYRGKGRPRVRGSTGTADRREAEAVERAVRMAVGGKTPRDRVVAVIDALMGADRVGEGLPLAGIWDVYRGWAEGEGVELSSTTWRQRRRAVERFAEWAGECWTAAEWAGDVGRACAAAFSEFLRAGGAGAKTRRNVAGELGAVWEGLLRCRDDVRVNPWRLVVPRSDSRRLPAFSVDEERRVLAAADGMGWGLACRIARYAGLRYGDVARLRWDQVVERGGGWVICLEPSKTARHGIAVEVPVCGALREALEGVRAAAEGEAAARLEGRSGRARARAVRSVARWAGYVLPEHARWYPKPSKGSMGAFAGVLAAAGVEGRHTFHSWRHTWRTRLAEAGVPDEIAMRLGGWTRGETALRYDHGGRAAELREAVERGAAAGA